jgi:hypothetical protein
MPGVGVATGRVGGTTARGGDDGEGEGTGALGRAFVECLVRRRLRRVLGFAVGAVWIRRARRRRSTSVRGVRAGLRFGSARNSAGAGTFESSPCIDHPHVATRPTSKSAATRCHDRRELPQGRTGSGRASIATNADGSRRSIIAVVSSIARHSAAREKLDPSVDRRPREWS